MKIETLRKCTAGCVCASFLLLASCVDEAYDLGKDLDLTIQVGGDLRLPGCNTEEITLKDLFDLDEDDPDNVIKTDAAGFYSLCKSGEGSDSEIDIRKVDVEDVEAMDAQSELTFVKQELDYQGRAESYIDEDRSHFEFSNKEVTKDLVAINWARPEANVPVTIRLSFDQEDNEVPVLHLMDDITMYVPTFLELEVDDSRLPAAERGVFLVRQMGDVHLLQRGEGGLAVHFLRRLEGRKVRRAAHHHHVQHRVGENGRVVLGDIGHQPGQLARLQFGGVLPVQADGAAAAAQYAHQQAEERGLAAAVGPHQAEDLPGVRRAGDAPDDVAGAVAPAQVLHFQKHTLTPSCG